MIPKSEEIDELHGVMEIMRKDIAWQVAAHIASMLILGAYTFYKLLQWLCSDLGSINWLTCIKYFLYISDIVLGCIIKILVVN